MDHISISKSLYSTNFIPKCIFFTNFTFINVQHKATILMDLLITLVVLPVIIIVTALYLTFVKHKKGSAPSSHSGHH